jgi:hypothetical protein
LAIDFDLLMLPTDATPCSEHTIRDWSKKNTLTAPIEGLFSTIARVTLDHDGLGSL